jgi:hypothetical protein
MANTTARRAYTGLTTGKPYQSANGPLANDWSPSE